MRWLKRYNACLPCSLYPHSRRKAGSVDIIYFKIVPGCRHPIYAERLCHLTTFRTPDAIQDFMHKRQQVVQEPQDSPRVLIVLALRHPKYCRKLIRGNYELSCFSKASDWGLSGYRSQ
ncbi:hypothetical protein PANT111_390006 [Pantoea brenneri]|uniref:Uncharacterized protein n=1 Tax=Pantoea brenneri TaxID=472694 RepID=A0AAX3JA04_9GAMM|nr:hypothetical protein PANT111_390006 [Pantoea brenneri]